MIFFCPFSIHFTIFSNGLYCIVYKSIAEGSGYYSLRVVLAGYIEMYFI